MISLVHVCKTYGEGRKRVRALSDLSLKVPFGSFTVIMGRSGSGKSTLLHLIGCLDTPTSGEIVFDNQRLADLTSDQRAEFRAQKIGFVFQRFNQIPNLSALENAELPMLLSGVPRSEARSRAERALRQVGLAGRFSHRPAQLSGGELQRVTIARALVNDPGALLADEPTGNLDTETGLLVISMLRELNHDGKACIIVTHDPDMARDEDRLVCMQDGQRIESLAKIPLEVTR